MGQKKAVMPATKASTTANQERGVKSTPREQFNQ